MSTDPFSYDPLPPVVAQPQAGAKNEKSSIESLEGTINLLDEGALAGNAKQPAVAESKSKGQRRAATPAIPTTKVVSSAATAGAKATRSRARVERPAMTLDEAIARGEPTSRVTELVKQWSAYERQEARLKADAEAKELAKQLAQRATEARRHAANILLTLADTCGCSMSEAIQIYQSALASKFPKQAENIAQVIAEAEANSRAESKDKGGAK